MFAIYKKELRSYFTSMTGYVFVAFILAVIGIYLTLINMESAYPDFAYTLLNLTIIFLRVTSILTMRILAETLSALNQSSYFSNFISGILEIRGAVYYLSIIVFCIFLTVQSIQKRGWS